MNHRLSPNLFVRPGERADLPRWASRRLMGIGFLRIGYGLIWAIDAWFKWQPGFVDNLTGYLKIDGQPAAIAAWITFWLRMVSVNPHVFAYLQASAETSLALCLILGAFTNLTCGCGFLLSLFIWSVPEGFGGPYVPGATDIGTGIIYALVFAGLFLASAGLTYGADQRLTSKIGRFGFLASGPMLAHTPVRPSVDYATPLLVRRPHDKAVVRLRRYRRRQRLGI
jgi:thiosulfate dehydrogenase (quinone) large subunit